MQTNQEVMDKVHELLSKSHETILAKANSLLHSGAIDLDEYEDNYFLPKALLVVALKECAENWRTPRDKELIKNLEHF